jgi:DNA-binding NarL/FixJ family response regulator
VSIRIALVGENKYESLLIADALAKKGIEVTHLLHTFAHLPQMLENSIPDVLVTSIGEDALKEIAIVEKVRSKHPLIGLVFLTSSPDLRLLGITEKDLPKGVQVIFKNAVTDLHILSRAIHDSADNSKEKSAVQWVTGKSFTDDSAFESNLTDLTQVQIETLRLLAQGRSNAEIAKLRFVTEKAVEHTITRILTVMNLKTNPRNNSRVMLSREYYRWIEVPKVRV